ncbi:hypothetical protein NSS79_26085 [Paenibacillus sp. FSL L8-0436]|uniref:hypothetical protein n=1 Tax=unclassified Paenibacillus TaxID=185978 RepID=UPI00315908ED
MSDTNKQEFAEALADRYIQLENLLKLSTEDSERQEAQIEFDRFQSVINDLPADIFRLVMERVTISD